MSKVQGSGSKVYGLGSKVQGLEQRGSQLIPEIFEPVSRLYCVTQGFYAQDGNTNPDMPPTKANLA